MRRMDNTQRRVTLKDVALAAGVSTTTVSHVINDKRGVRIGDDARQRVREAVDQLGYRPNVLAKNLVEGGSGFIGLVADSIASTPFAGQIIRGAQDEAWRHGLILLVANIEDSLEAEHKAISKMLGYNVRGILYSKWYHHQTTLPAELVETNHVLVNCFSAGTSAQAVVPDEESGARAAVRQLLDAGHQRIALLNTSTPSPAHTGRLAGYRQALEEAGITLDGSLIRDCEPVQEGGYGATDWLLTSGATGVCCHNDRVAMGLYDGLKEQGVSIPEDISVVGFDDQEVIAGHLRPPLSTVALPHYELGATGVRVLLGLEEPPATGLLRIACPPVPRQSVASPSTSRST